MWEALAATARRQHSLFTYAQALGHGMSSSALSRHCERGLVERRAPRVYALAGAPVTARQEVLVHVLAAGRHALATADSALGLWCPELELPAQPEIVVPRSCGYRSTDARVRRSSDLELANPGRIDGIPVVGVARALLDAAAGRSTEEVLERVGSCRRHLPLAIGALVDVAETHARRGRPGLATFRAALQHLCREVPDSEFERLVLRDLRRAGIDGARLHHVVRIAGEDPIELDIDFPGVLLDVELDGRDHVERSRVARRDRQRDRLLQAVGYVVLRYTWDDYVGDRTAMIDEIGRFRAGLRTGVGGSRMWD